MVFNLRPDRSAYEEVELFLCFGVFLQLVLFSKVSHCLTVITFVVEKWVDIVKHTVGTSLGYPTPVNPDHPIYRARSGKGVDVVHKNIHSHRSVKVCNEIAPKEVGKIRSTLKNGTKSFGLTSLLR